ncbi:MAG TPA: tyrosine-type recombinase/integrase [Chloroflexota bacterium]|nr:tyrosine-type recombinase/integrase [Chloroflexota bacterium]
MARRGNSEGSIYQRSDGYWVAAVSTSGKRRVVYAKTRREVAEKLAALQQAASTGTLVGASRLTVKDFMQQWLDAASLTCKPSTLYGYRVVVRCHLVPEVGALALQKLAAQHIVRLYQAKRQQGLSPRRVQIIHAVLHRALTEAVRWRLVPRNVADDVKPPRQEHQEPRIWSLDEVRAFVNTAQSSADRYAPALVLALALGLRESELLGLRWDSLSTEQGTITVDRALTWVGGVPTWGTPKSRAGRRVLPLPQPAREALARLREQQDQDRFKAGHDWQPTEGRIVTSRVGTVPTPNRLKDTLDRLCARAAVPRLTVHQLRHQCASLLFAAGADIKQVQHFLGHSRASVTLDVYMHLLNATSGEMARRLDQMLG